jgi:hypothetical protein
MPVEVLNCREQAIILIDGEPWLRNMGGTGFAPKAVQGLRVLGNVVGEEFQSDEAPKVGVLGFVNHTHSPAAQLLDDAVMGDGLAYHWAEILGPGLRQVNEGVEVGGVPERRLATNRHYTH